MLAHDSLLLLARSRHQSRAERPTSQINIFFLISNIITEGCKEYVVYTISKHLLIGNIFKLNKNLGDLIVILIYRCSSHQFHGIYIIHYLSNLLKKESYILCCHSL
jgi:hypothetical protein